MNKTRYQILYVNSSRVENFTAKERTKFLRRQAELKTKGVKFTVWDTQRNTMSHLFKF